MSEPEQEAVQPIYEVLAALCDFAHSRDTAPSVPFASLPRRVFVALKDAWEAESDAQMMQEYSKLPWLKVHAPTSHTHPTLTVPRGRSCQEPPDRTCST